MRHDRTRRSASGKSNVRAEHRPLITLTTDFGLTDYYVAAMKAVLVRHCPRARLIDVTHQVPPQDVLCGAITLERAVDGFPPGTTHLAVIDPGVGTDRRMLIVEINQQPVVCPDNGLITWAWRMHGGGAAHEITWRPEKIPSHTFHGRDVFAPVAGMLACGTPLQALARPIDDPTLLDVAPVSSVAERGRVIHIDHFGNATTNIAHELLKSEGADASRVIRIKGKPVGKLRRTYWDVAPGKPLALIGSSGLLEIAVRDGSAAESLKVRVGDEVVVS
jgi:S-adenosylmethionine hydrolase